MRVRRGRCWWRSRVRRRPAGQRRRARGRAPARSSSRSGTTSRAGSGRRRRAPVGGEVAERRVLLVADRRHDRHRARDDRAHEPLVAERQQVLEAAAAAGEDDDVDVGLGRDRARARRRSPPPRAVPGRRSRRRATRAGGKRVWIAVSTSRFAAASLPVTSPIRRGSRGSGRLRDSAKSPSAASFAFSRSSAARCSPSPKRSIESRAQPQLALLLAELRAAVDVDALAVREVEPQRVELSARHRGGEARAALRDP